MPYRLVGLCLSLFLLLTNAEAMCHEALMEEQAEHAALEKARADREVLGHYLQSDPAILRQFSIFPKDTEQARVLLKNYWEHTWFNLWNNFLSLPIPKSIASQEHQKAKIGVHLLLHPKRTPQMEKLAREVLAGWDSWEPAIKLEFSLHSRKELKEDQALLEEVKDLPSSTLGSFIQRNTSAIEAPKSTLPSLLSKKSIGYFCIGGMERSLGARAEAEGFSQFAGIKDPMGSVLFSSGGARFGSEQALVENDLIFSMEGPAYRQASLKRRESGERSAITLGLPDAFSKPVFRSPYFRAIELLLLEDLVSASSRIHQGDTFY